MSRNRTAVRLTAVLRPAPSLADVERALLRELTPYADGAHHVPNAWTVELAGRDSHRRAGDLAGWSAALAGRLLAEHDRLGLPPSGQLTVGFADTADVAPGRFRVSGAVVHGPAPVRPRTGLLPGCPRLVLPAGGTARLGTARAAGVDREVMVPPGRLVIGRDRGADLRLTDPTVSPRHVELEAGADGVRLRDLGALNGTTVDGVPVRSADLQDGNRIQVGGTTLVFHRDPTGGPAT